MPTSTSNNDAIGITMGDPSGIGPEVLAKSLRQKSIQKISRFTVFGQRKILRKYGLRETGRISIIEPAGISRDGYPPGKLNTKSGQASLLCLESAVEQLKEKRIKALVTAPVTKQAINLIRPRFKGHTEYLAQKFRTPFVGMMFVAEGMKVVIATRHVPLKQVVGRLSADLIERTIQMTQESLKKHFKIKRPRIAVCGINPHAGEGGKIGKDDSRIVVPAVRKAAKKNIAVKGPFPADTLFVPENAGKFDCIIAMYHDQGLIPVKTLYFHQLVNLTVGLPFIRTSPAHGTAYDIAGKRKADASSMTEAIRLAARLS